MLVGVAALKVGPENPRYIRVEKSMYGRSYFGIEHATHLIDGDGVIRRIWRKVKVGGHVEEVLEAVTAL